MAASSMAGDALDATASTEACDAGQADACIHLGRAYFDGEGVPSDRFRAVQLFRRGCELGDAHGCMFLAESYRTGEGVRPDTMKASELYLQACELGDGLACRSVGDLYTMGTLGGVGGKSAGVWYSLGCDLGDAQSCTAAALWLERGASDPDQALSLFGRGCDGGHPRGCTMIGDRTLRGSDGAKKDPEAAYVWYAKGCAVAFDPESCRELGLGQLKGRSVAPDRKAGIENLDRACYANEPVACRYLAAELKDESGAEAFVAAQRGCELGDEASCRVGVRLKWKADLKGNK